MILAIDPGNIYSAYVLVEEDLSRVVDKGKIENDELLKMMVSFKLRYEVSCVAIEMIASYGMAVGATVFETCVWIGRFTERATQLMYEVEYVYRKEEKMLLCNSMKAKDSNIAQALIDLFAKDTPNKGKGTKKEPGYFYGFKSDIWAAMAVAYVYHTKFIGTEC